MGIITHLETITAPFLAYGVDIRDIIFTLEPEGDSVTVIAGSGANARYIEFETDGSGSILNSGFLGYSPADFTELEYSARSMDISMWRLDSQLEFTQNGQMSAANVSSLNNGFAGDNMLAVWAEVGGEQWLVTSDPDAAGLISFDWNGSDEFTPTDTTTGVTNTTFSDLSSVVAFGKTWVIGTSADEDVVSVYSIAADGSLEFHTRSGVANGLWIGTPVAQSIVSIDGQPFVIVASFESSSISVLRLEADGTLIPVDHVIDNLATRFGDASHIETAEIDGTFFAVVSGADDGFSVFQIRDDGHLIYLASQEDTLTSTLNNISSLTIGYDADGLHIFAASGNEIGLSHFTYDTGPIGQSITGTPAADVIIGTGDNDVLMGGAGDDQLTGGAGDDILVDGAGSDSLTGGAGADRFVLDYDGETDTITDFEAGVDSLDLSYFPLLYIVDDLDFTTTLTGARITFNAEIIEIYSNDGSSLSLNDVFGISAFDLTRPLSISGGGEPDASAITILGSASDDLLIGTPSDDYFSGGLGSDTMIGGAGADTFYGGYGFDTVDYSTSSGAVTVDMNAPASNSGDAAGDTFYSVESISGTGFGDDLMGSNQADMILGADGNDTLMGRGGNDALYGGTGNDTLSGGAGSDVLDGGSGIDLISYSGASFAVRVDLGNQLTNTGDAAGDVITGIENVLGSGWDDTIFGDGSANSIWGEDGADWIIGNGGDDALYGGAQDDVLGGGAGADILDGGSGVDTATYASAKSGLVIDLSNPSAGTGDAMGDIFVSVENVIGSRFADTITGDAAENSLYGSGGNDTLFGLDGDDHLSGGFEDDRLVGGAGNDTLLGGSGHDTFVFADGFGDDVILDFDAEVDQIELDANVFAILPASTAELLSTYASTSGGYTVLDFGDAGSITLNGITDFTVLEDVFAIV